MKIGVLSDIHGNSVALRAVLHEVSQAQVDELFVLGDFVGYYYSPDEVLALLAPFTKSMVRGNHETMLEVAQHNEGAKERVRAKYGSGVSYAVEKLTPNQIRDLLALPETAKVTRDGVTFLLCHGSPWDNDEYVYPDASPRVLRRCAKQRVDFVLLGHTHHPFTYAHRGTVVLNPGSIGQPRDVGNSASWAIINTTNRSVVHRRTIFDSSTVAQEARLHDAHLPYLADVLGRNRYQS